MADLLHQLTMSYQPAADRLLLRIRTRDGNEYRLELTRRFVKMAWAVILEALSDEGGARGGMGAEARTATLAFQHQSAVRESDFSRPHEKAGTTLPFGEAPLLVTGLSGKTVGQSLLRLTFKSAGGRNVAVSLDSRLLHSFCHMLIETTRNAAWGLDLESGLMPALVPEAGTQVH